MRRASSSVETAYPSTCRASLSMPIARSGTAQRALKWLVEQRYIHRQLPEHVQQNGVGNGRGNENAYQIRLRRAEAPAREIEDRRRGDNVTPINRREVTTCHLFS